MTDEELRGVARWLRSGINEAQKPQFLDIQRPIAESGADTPNAVGISGDPREGAGFPAEEERGVRRSLQELRANVEALTGNVKASAAGYRDKEASASDGAGPWALSASALPATSGVWGTIGRGLGLSPILGGLLRLFGRRDEEPPAPLAKYVSPAPFLWEEGLSAAAGGRAMVIDRGASGEPRLAGAGGGTSPTIQVNVQAIDSRSFLEHRDAIASAVREALLQSHDLKDVLQEI